MCGVARLEALMLQLLRRAVVAGYASEQAGMGCAWLERERTRGGAAAGAAEGQHASGTSLEAALLQAIRCGGAGQVLSNTAQSRVICEGAAPFTTAIASTPTSKHPSNAGKPATNQNTNRHSQFAGELVVPGAVALARQLLACPVASPLHLVMACAADSGAPGGAAAGRAPSQAPAGTRAVRLGLLLLGAVFEHHAEARTEVLRSCQVGTRSRTRRLGGCRGGLKRGAMSLAGSLAPTHPPHQNPPSSAPPSWRPACRTCCCCRASAPRSPRCWPAMRSR
jgi:hypothetical protein